MIIKNYLNFIKKFKKVSIIKFEELKNEKTFEKVFQLNKEQSIKIIKLYTEKINTSLSIDYYMKLRKLIIYSEISQKIVN